MADNVSISAGSGTDIATDEVTGTGEHVQIVKLAIAADGSRTALPGDGTDGLLVNLGTNNDVVVSATDLDIRNLVQATDSVKVGDGTSLIDIDTAPTDGETNGGKRLLHCESWLWGYNGTSWDRLRSDTTNGLDVDVTRVGGTVTVSGSVTANAGTNLNTSALALETGGNLAASATSLAVIDNPVIVDDNAFTPATTSVMMSGFFVDDTSTDSADEGDGGAARMTPDRRIIVQIGESGAKDIVGGGSKTDTSDQEIMAASAGLYNVLTWATFYNASSTNTYAIIKDGSTTRAIVPLPAYGGAIWQPTRGLRSTVNTAINIAAGASVTTAYFYGGGYRTSA